MAAEGVRRSRGEPTGGTHCGWPRRKPTKSCHLPMGVVLSTPRKPRSADSPWGHARGREDSTLMPPQIGAYRWIPPPGLVGDRKRADPPVVGGGERWRTVVSRGEAWRPDGTSERPRVRPCVPAQARFDMRHDGTLLSGLGAAASANASVVIGGGCDAEHDAHPANGRAFRRGCWREICAHFEVADRRQGRHPADTTSRGPDRAHGFLFVPELHAGTSDEPRATTPHRVRIAAFSRSPAQKDFHQCRAPCSRNRR